MSTDEESARPTEPATVQLPAGRPPADAESAVVRVSERRNEDGARRVGPAAGPRSTVQELREVSFATSWRGYDQAAVDAYVRKVNRVIEDLRARQTPQEIVRRALDRVGQETSAILREAEKSAERITSQSRAQAAERVQRAEREAEAIIRRSVTRLRQLDQDIDRIWLERQRLIEDTRKLADTMLRVADDAEERFPPEDAGAGQLPPAADARPQPPAAEPRVPAGADPAAAQSSRFQRAPEARPLARTAADQAEQAEDGQSGSGAGGQDGHGEEGPSRKVAGRASNQRPG